MQKTLYDYAFNHKCKLLNQQIYFRVSIKENFISHRVKYILTKHSLAYRKWLRIYV